MSRLKFGNVLICDLATQGFNNKHTLVNVYSGEIIMSTPGTAVLSLYIEHYADKDGELGIAFDFLLNKETIAELRIEASDLKKGAMGVVVVPPMPLLLNKAGTLRIIAKATGYHNTTLLEKGVAIGPIPSPTA